MNWPDPRSHTRPCTGSLPRRGIGYSISPMPVRRNASDAAMRCFRAGHGGDAVAVCEMIRDEHGSIWPDVSARYWSAIFGASSGPWWSFVVAERM